MELKQLNTKLHFDMGQNTEGREGGDGKGKADWLHHCLFTSHKHVKMVVVGRDQADGKGKGNKHGTCKGAMEITSDENSFRY